MAQAAVSILAPLVAAAVRRHHGRIPSLDGLRAVSILMVLFAHLQDTSGFTRSLDGAGYFGLGALGVRVFFVISAPRSRILLLGILPRADRLVPGRDTIQAVNRILMTLHDGQHVTYLDVGPRLVATDGRLSPHIAPDGVHLSEAGYRICADAILGPLRALLGEEPDQAAHPDLLVPPC